MLLEIFAERPEGLLASKKATSCRSSAAYHARCMRTLSLLATFAKQTYCTEAAARRHAPTPTKMSAMRDISVKASSGLDSALRDSEKSTMRMGSPRPFARAARAPRARSR